MKKNDFRKRVGIRKPSSISKSKSRRSPTIEYLECCICYSKDSEVKQLQTCQHTVHYECLSKHFKPECPVCRRPNNEVIFTGIRPSSDDDDLLITLMLEEIAEAQQEDSDGSADSQELIPRHSHRYAIQDNELVMDVFRRMAAGQEVSDEEIYASQVALRRARHQDETLVCLSDEEEGSSGSSSSSLSSSTSRSESNDSYG